MDSEQSKNFNDRLRLWVASQGFWFQLRYSMSGSGMKGRALIHLFRLGFQLLVCLLLVAVGIWIYLIKRTDSAAFAKELRQDLQAGLSASALEMKGGRRSQGQLEINRLALEGGNETFFTSMEARNVRCKMGLVDGLVGMWRPGIISVLRLNLDLRAGTDDAESASKLSAALFQKSAKIELDTFDVADATIRWGYSERTEGSIESSMLKMQRTETGWRLSFKGGLFHQNWLHQLEIVELVVMCDADGLIFEKAECKQGDGTVDFSGLQIIGGERPQVKGTVRIRNMNLDKILPAALGSFVGGSISGDFRVFGSTNSSDGVGFEGQVLLGGRNVISVREKMHLLKALSVVDYARNYHRLDFREGSFQMKTIRSGLELSKITMSAEEVFALEGDMNVRLPTQKEIQAAKVADTGEESSPLFAGSDLIYQGKADEKSESSFTLKRAAQEARRIKEGSQSADSMSLFDRLNLNSEMRRLQSQSSERMSRMLRYEGNLQITIPGDAFERAPKLRERYPADAGTGRIPIMVPISGHLYELTLKQAEDIYQQGQR